MSDNPQNERSWRHADRWTLVRMWWRWGPNRHLKQSTIWTFLYLEYLASGLVALVEKYLKRDRAPLLPDGIGG
ncbi:hypothetical protein [Pseudomonas sp.]|uniref:hypothetical protein n=1 Tax=Pseudomonas sp. TaxID=306 RepID=UPI003C56E8F2